MKAIVLGLALGVSLNWIRESGQSGALFDEVERLADNLSDSLYFDPDMTHPNIQAFLLMIGTADGDGYRRLFGGRLFDSYADHPRIKITANLGGKPITSTAAGAYQILANTWDAVRPKLGLPNFSPASQDCAAVELIRG